MLLDLVRISKTYNMQISGVIHIGAHYGEENNVYDELNIEHRIFVEPLKRNFDKLKENIPSRYRLVNKALGTENTTVQMYVETANNSQSCSILEPGDHLIQYPTITFDEKETVQMTRLDDLDIEADHYNFINIDVQGYELHVFKGGKNVLSHTDYIVTEVNRADVYKGCAQLPELAQFLGKFGFQLVEICWAGGSWGDAFFTKRPQDAGVGKRIANALKKSFRRSW